MTNLLYRWINQRLSNWASFRICEAGKNLWQACDSGARRDNRTRSRVALSDREERRSDFCRQARNIGREPGVALIPPIVHRGEQEEIEMPQQQHNKAADAHEQAAKTHRNAAEQHGKGDHAKGQEHSTQAHSQSEAAHMHSKDAHSQSKAQMGGGGAQSGQQGQQGQKDQQGQQGQGQHGQGQQPGRK
jgi:hypothetical protein